MDALPHCRPQAYRKRRSSWSRCRRLRSQTLPPRCASPRAPSPKCVFLLFPTPPPLVAGGEYPLALLRRGQAQVRRLLHGGCLKASLLLPPSATLEPSPTPPLGHHLEGAHEIQQDQGPGCAGADFPRGRHCERLDGEREENYGHSDGAASQALLSAPQTIQLQSNKLPARSQRW